MKVGFIGTGNMASAIISGVISKKYMESTDIYCFDINQNKLEEFAKEKNINACKSNEELINNVDFVVLAIKPQFFAATLSDLKEVFIKNNSVIISIAAGTSIEMLENMLSAELPMIRVMPNVNAIVGAGVSAICNNTKVTKDQFDFVYGLFSAIGLVFDIAEKDFSAYTAIAGSSPAFSYMYIDSLARAAVKNGIPKDLATKIAAQAVLGSAKMILESDKNPWELVDMVSSPGGTTVVGVLALEEEAFIATIAKGVQAVIDKDLAMLNKK